MDLEGRGGGPVELPSLKFLGLIEEYKKKHVIIAVVPKAIRNTRLPRTVLLLRYHYKSLLGENRLVGVY